MFIFRPLFLSSLFFMDYCDTSKLLPCACSVVELPLTMSFLLLETVSICPDLPTAFTPSGQPNWSQSVLTQGCLTPLPSALTFIPQRPVKGLKGVLEVASSAWFPSVITENSRFVQLSIPTPLTSQCPQEETIQALLGN